MTPSQPSPINKGRSKLIYHAELGSASSHNEAENVTRIQPQIPNQVRDDMKKSAISENQQGSNNVKDLSSYSPIVLSTRKRFAFTLAEVLITLGIIGVVAAMTLPTLISNYQKQETVSKLKKNYAIIGNAISLANVENGGHFAIDVNASSSPDLFLEKYFFPYLNVMKKCESDNNAECFTEKIYKLDGVTAQNTINSNWRTFVLSDGTAIALKDEINLDSNEKVNYRQITMRADINGKAKPNRFGRDVFCFEMRYYNSCSDFSKSQIGKLVPCFQGNSQSELAATNGACASDKTSHGIGCSALIMKNGWEMPKDYPW